jgi:hypothetical protein
MAQSRGGIDRSLADVDLVVALRNFIAPEYLIKFSAALARKSSMWKRRPAVNPPFANTLLNGAAAKIGHCIREHHARMQSILHLLHCSLYARRGAEPFHRDIVAECHALSLRLKEITLLGQIVTSYGKRDIPVQDGKSAFVQLLKPSTKSKAWKDRFTSLIRRATATIWWKHMPPAKAVESAHIPVRAQRRDAEIDAPRLHRETISFHRPKLRKVSPQIASLPIYRGSPKPKPTSRSSR